MKRHATDIVSLIFGLLFAAIAAYWVVGFYLVGVRISIPDLGLFVAGMLIVVGLLGVLGSLRGAREPVATTDSTGNPPTATAPDTIGPTDTDTVHSGTANTASDIDDPPPGG